MPIGKKNVLIRQAGIQDAGLIAELGARTFKESFGADNRPEDMAQYVAKSFSSQRMHAELADPSATFLLAYEAKEPIGYAKLKHGKMPECLMAAQSLELVRIYVETDVIGRGYGSALMRACLDAGKREGFQSVWLGVWEKNLRAIKFYEKWGFTRVGSQEFPLGSDVQIDAVMECSLAAQLR